MARIPFVLVASISFLASASAQVGVDANQLGFGYCPPPVVPHCIDASARDGSRRRLDACSRDVLRFTQSLGAYRACLTRESERAIGTGNAAIARFRCLAERRGGCH